jgi:hypothetical protein
VLSGCGWRGPTHTHFECVGEENPYTVWAWATWVVPYGGELGGKLGVPLHSVARHAVHGWDMRGCYCEPPPLCKEGGGMFLVPRINYKYIVLYESACLCKGRRKQGGI